MELEYYSFGFTQFFQLFQHSLVKVLLLFLYYCQVSYFIVVISRATLVISNAIISNSQLIN